MSAPSENEACAAIDQVARALVPSGLHVRGLITLGENDGPQLQDGKPARCVLLLGQVGGSIWPAFTAWRQDHPGPDPLDRWSKSVILPVAQALGATAYFPSDPPWQPFQRWAMRAEGLRKSPLGILIHPRFGLWHGYRGALGFAEDLVPADAMATAEASDPDPCGSCLSKPCLSACPAGAVSAAGFDLAACRSFLRGPEGGACMGAGCLARNACPVGQDYRYPVAQLQFHMNALGDVFDHAAAH